eukprot:5973703-Prymnesium_polylepis.1
MLHRSGPTVFSGYNVAAKCRVANSYCNLATYIQFTTRPTRVIKDQRPKACNAASKLELTSYLPRITCHVSNKVSAPAAPPKMPPKNGHEYSVSPCDPHMIALFVYCSLLCRPYGHGSSEMDKAWVHCTRMGTMSGAACSMSSPTLSCVPKSRFSIVPLAQRPELVVMSISWSFGAAGCPDVVRVTGLGGGTFCAASGSLGLRTPASGPPFKCCSICSAVMLPCVTSVGACSFMCGGAVPAAVAPPRSSGTWPDIRSPLAVSLCAPAADHVPRQ